MIDNVLSMVCIAGILSGGGVWLTLRLLQPPSEPARIALSSAEADRKQLLRDLTRALANGEIYLAYQPKLQLRSSEVEGVEALLRWYHPTLGMVSRELLIPLVESEGRIRELTIWVLRQALVDQRRLAAGGHIVSVHINVSAGLLADTAFVQEVCALTDSPCGGIGLEITETVFIENSVVAMASLKRLIEQGIAISIDDYGSGMSSLAYLKELPANELKIDKMFISGMTSSHRDPLIVRSTIDLAHALGLKVVAEGVESEAVLALLRVMGCDMAQGFLICPAVAIGALETFLGAGGYQVAAVSEPPSLDRPQAFWTRTVREPRAPAPAIAANN